VILIARLQITRRAADPLGVTRSARCGRIAGQPVKRSDGSVVA
jgi:hypothetical protein